MRKIFFFIILSSILFLTNPLIPDTNAQTCNPACEPGSYCKVIDGFSGLTACVAAACWEPNTDRSDCIYVCTSQREGAYQTKDECYQKIGKGAHTPQSPLICSPTNKTCTTAFGLTINVSDPTAFISQLMVIILGITGAITVILIIIAGFTYMTSGGDKQKVAGARETLISAITGLLFIVFSLAILGFIGVNVLGIPSFR